MMGGDPYFSHLSSPPPPGLPIFTLYALLLLNHPGSTIHLYDVRPLSPLVEKQGFSMKKILTIRRITYVLIVALLGTVFPASSNHTSFLDYTIADMSGPPTPPQQPTEGPGGSNYSYAGVRQSRYGFGMRQFWMFEPKDPTPSSAPLIVFNHGWSAFYPFYYKAWIVHLVRRGSIVVYPRYQLTPIIGSRSATQNAIHAVQQAIAILQGGNHVTPDLERFAIVGHSLGGGITAEMAALAADVGLPNPKAIMPVQPFVRLDTMMKDFHAIPASALLLVVVGENDLVVGNASGKTIFTTADQIPLDRKDFIIQRTDRYGSPALLANHGAPLCIQASASVDAMDFYSTWKLFDALTDYAFYGTNQQYCLGDTPEQRFMGLWSDGTPVQELMITDTP
jgi:pimeloyl-ACP methyl ester carboxylesterase